jgi:hypothetical protein
MLALFLLPGSLLQADDPGAMPRKFHAAIGGFLGPSCGVEMTGPDTLTYTYTPRPSGAPPKPQQTTIKVTGAQWKVFRARLDAAKVWAWEENYTNPSILDGTLWNILIDFGGKRMKSEGRNAYPERAQFDAMLAAVQELLGGKEFR